MSMNAEQIVNLMKSELERAKVESKELYSACSKLSKRGKILQLIGEVLVPVGLIAVMMFYALYPTVVTLLVPLVVALTGFILDSIGGALQEEANERLKNFYREKMLSNDAVLMAAVRGEE